MEHVIEVGKFVAANWQELLAGTVMTLSGVIAVAMVIPGEQPEKALQKVVDFLAKFSRKPKAE